MNVYQNYVMKFKISGESIILKPGKLNILIDGNLGSTGKGLIASYIGTYEHVDIAVSSGSPNAGHTFYRDGQPYVTHHLPIVGVLNKRCTIYLCAGAIIDPVILLKEIDTFNILPDNLYIHPRAAVIEAQDIDSEQEGGVKKIASTRKGVGAALSRKINREAKLAGDCPSLKPFVHELDLQFYLDQDCTGLIEVPQGFDLSLNSGLAYPYCTSREITVSQSLSDAQVHPEYLGNVIVCIRTFPIRVGNIVEEGKIVGYSGPFYSDSKELTWKEIGVPPEYTTNTHRKRRVATFSHSGYSKVLKYLKPDYVFLNFCNYLSEMELDKLLDTLPKVTHLGFGPEIKDIELNI